MHSALYARSQFWSLIGSKHTNKKVDKSQLTLLVTQLSFTRPPPVLQAAVGLSIMPRLPVNLTKLRPHGRLTNAEAYWRRHEAISQSAIDLYDMMKFVSRCHP